jgi:hypothetical protein
MITAIAAPKDSATFYYVVQNPKFFGLKEARSWFEISGVSDKSVEQKINAYLKTIFFEKTELDTVQGGAIQPAITPKGYTDYTFYNGQTYGEGYIRFKDTDSLLYLTKADGYFGSGTNLGGFSQETVPDKLASLWIEPSSFKSTGNSVGRSIDLGFDLRTGNTIPLEYVVMVDPAMRDSLENVLKAKALQQVNNSLYSGGVIIGSEYLSDSVVVTLAQVIRWMNGVKYNYPMVVSRYFSAKTTMISDGREVRWKPLAQLTFDEAIPFIREEDMKKLAAL